ncbi:MAG: hypothetical protein PHF63_08580 [Herbinix sp.]|nr:hypothetical protein [Herbinix sp.]
MNNSKKSSSKNTGKSSFSNNTTDYKYSPNVETPNPKATTDKSPSSGNIKGV